MHKELRKQNIKRIENFFNRIKMDILTNPIPMEAEYYSSKDPVKFENRLKTQYLPIKEGVKWGETWDSAWFHIKGKLPDDWKGKDVVARMDFGGEALIFDNKGCPVYGLTSGSVFEFEYNKDFYRLFEPAQGGEDVEL